MVRIAILGFGSSGHRFLQLVSKWNPRAQVLVYSSRKLALSGQDSTTQLKEIRAFDPEIAIVCGSATHRVTMIAALPQSLMGLLIEKPLAADLELGREVVARIESTSAMVQVGYNLRFSPSLNDFRRRLDLGEFGPVHSVRAETGQFLPSWRAELDYRSSVSAQAALGGGVLLELSHEIDYLQWLFGEIEWVSAIAGRHSDLEIDVEDTAHLTFGFASSPERKQLVGQLNLDFVRHDLTRSVTAICSGGSLKWDGVAGQVEAWPQDQSNWETVFRDPVGTSTYDLQWEAFISAVSGSGSPGATVGEGISVLEVIAAARLSSQGGGRMISVAGGGGVR